jgi:hypothetical protein
VNGGPSSFRVAEKAALGAQCRNRAYWRESDPGIRASQNSRGHATGKRRTKRSGPGQQKRRSGDNRGSITTPGLAVTWRWSNRFPGIRRSKVLQGTEVVGKVAVGSRRWLCQGEWKFGRTSSSVPSCDCVRSRTSEKREMRRRGLRGCSGAGSWTDRPSAWSPSRGMGTAEY